MRKNRGATRATRGKLVRALEALESFRDSDDIDTVIDRGEKRDLDNALQILHDIESTLFHKEMERKNR